MKPPNLNKINLQTLQNINEDDIKQFCNKHITILINISLIVIVFFAIIFIINRQTKAVNVFKKEVAELEEKQDEVKKAELVNGQYDEMVNLLPPFISSDELRNKISNIALETNVQIISFEPKGETVGEYIKTNNFEMNILSKNYRNILLFTSKIEEIPNAVRIDKWAGKMEESIYKGENIQTRESPISGVLMMTAIKINENE